MPPGTKVYTLIYVGDEVLEGYSSPEALQLKAMLSSECTNDRTETKDMYRGKKGSSKIPLADFTVIPVRQVPDWVVRFPLRSIKAWGSRESFGMSVTTLELWKCASSPPGFLVSLIAAQGNLRGSACSS